MLALEKIRLITRPLSRIRGLRRITERVQKAYSGRSAPIEITDFDQDLRFRCYLNSHISSHIFWRGSYSYLQLRLLERILQPSMCFMDVGANEGEHTVFAAKRLGQGRVYSFEPCTEIFNRLQWNVDANSFKRVTLIKKGLSDREETTPLYGSANAYSDGSSNLGLSSVYSRPGVNQIIEQIELITLDEFAKTQAIDQLDVMKVDVEGSELAVLKGASATLRRLRPAILLEISPETSVAAGHSTRELIDHMLGHGYRIENILDDGSTSPADAASGRFSRDVICYPR